MVIRRYLRRIAGLVDVDAPFSRRNDPLLLFYTSPSSQRENSQDCEPGLHKPGPLARSIELPPDCLRLSP